MSIMIKYIMSFCLILLVATAYTQDSLSLQQRVKILEQYKDEVLNERFDAQSESLKSEVQSEMKAAKLEIESQLSTIRFVGSICGIILAAGLIASVYQFFWGIRKTAERMLKKKLETHLADNTSYIIDVITSQKTENLIKANKKIALICGEKDEEEQAVKLLKSMHFKKLEATTAKFYAKLPDADLYVFCNQSGKLHEELILEFLQKSSEDDTFVYFGNRLNYDPKAAYADRINFANSRYQLYHNMLNTLSFKEVIKTKYHE